ncbi:MAG TPA: M1 family metallopeptidase [Candidatus Polarisedimenticolia bacterium]|jgi:aminopeptidase N
MWLVTGLAMLAAGGAPADVHSYARPAEVRVTHIDLDLEIRFAEKVLSGSAVLYLNRAPGIRAPLRLDTRDLTILRVSAGRSAGAGGAARMSEAKWTLGARDPILGSELTIQAPDDADLVRIEYRTSPEATGLQWLSPEQTAGGKHPYLYSQSQAIHARSWVPCQDSPGIRVTFDAKVRVAPPLVAVMAAEKLTSGPAEPGLFRFRMTHPIPPYLIAIGAGELVFGAIGPRTGVWAEPSVLPRAVYEFADMEKMLQAAEKTYGPYRWGRYDILILPPSFPFGGMENPMLTFATPTILAGDRSLVALVAHEMAHSWSGNLVTNATWSDFWLNEGFTTYIEHRIMETVYGRERTEMEWVLNRQDLEEELKGLADKPGDQALRIDLTGRDPDDGATDVAYDKGSLLLRLLEETYGRGPFDAFLRSWFDEHAFTSVTTDDFLAFLRERLMAKSPPVAGRTPPDLAPWIDGPGIPPGAPVATSDALEKAEEQAARWASGKAGARQLDTSGWSFHLWLRFLRALPESLEAVRMKELDDAFGFTKTGNSEILDEWLILSVRHGYEPAAAKLEQFLTQVGRRKYLKPIYQELMKTEAGKVRARAIYAKARPMYQAIARRSLDEIVGWPVPPPAS